jgi:DMSO reductase anchor subunit
MKHEAEQELLKTLNGQLSELPTVAKTMIQQYQTSAIVLSIIFGVLFIATLIIIIWLALYLYKKVEVSNSYNDHDNDNDDMWYVLFSGILLNIVLFISLIINIIHACTPITSIIGDLLN